MYRLQEILDLTTQHFTRLKLENPRLEAEVLLADFLDKERIHLYMSFDQPLNPKEVDAFRERVRLRGKGCPTAYITGKKEFLSREFSISREVLIPRPETEHLVESVASYFEGVQGLTMADIGTGSGIIAISLALSSPTSLVYATDLSPGALEVAAKNRRQYALEERVHLLLGNLLEPLEERELDALVSNPPYIPERDYERLSPEIRDFEPSSALKGGRDGLKFIRPLIEGARYYLKSQGLLALEVGYGQMNRVKDLVLRHSYQLEEVVEDYGGIPRVILARKR